ncbi:DUF1501 domain-containing protein [bacterium]|nr:DUF1501 domain-containing protein [bacterium]
MQFDPCFFLVECLFGAHGHAVDWRLADSLPQFVRWGIFLTQSGGPSQLELDDHKLGLVKRGGQKMPNSVRGGQRLSGMTKSKLQ